MTINLHTYIRIRSYRTELNNLLKSSEPLTEDQRFSIEMEIGRVANWLEREKKRIEQERSDWGGQTGY